MAPEAIRHIVAVDDEGVVIGVVARMLRKAGYRVSDFLSPLDALPLLEDPSQPVDLLLTDVRMPRMTGPELAAHARDARPELPILFVSAYTDFDDRPTPFGAPLLLKPFSMSTLLEAVEVQLAPVD